MAGKKQTTETPYTSQRKFADAIGCAASTLAGYVKRDDWPIARSGPWSDEDLNQVLRWRQYLQEDRAADVHASGGPEGPPPRGGDSGASGGGGSQLPPAGASGGGFDPSVKAKAETMIKLSKARQEKVKAEQAEGSVISTEEAEQATVGLALMVAGMLQEIRDGLPHKLDGDPAVNEPIVADALDDALRRLLAEEEIQLATLEEVATAKARGQGKRQSTGRKGIGR